MNARIELLRPIVADKCRALISLAAEDHIRIIVTSTLRTTAEQRALYAQGRKKLDEVNALRRIVKWGPITFSENHNVTYSLVSVHEYGLAFDIAVIDPTTNHPAWDDRFIGAYKRVGEIGESLDLTWGGRFPHPDMPHFEYTGGLTLAQIIAGELPV